MSERVTLEIVPVKLLRSFCVQQRYGIKSLSTLSKANLITTLRQVDPEVENTKLPVWLAANPWYTVEALPGGGRRLTQSYNDGTKRIYEEDQNGSFEVRYVQSDRRNPCDPGCPGWAVFETGDETLEIEACNDCWHGVENPLTDDEAALLPEAQYALGVEVATRHVREHGGRKGRWEFCPLCVKEK